MPLSLFDDDEEEKIKDEDVPELNLDKLVLEDGPVTTVEDEMPVELPRRSRKKSGETKPLPPAPKNVPVPPPEELQEEFEEKPRVYLGPYAIVLQDRLNVVVHRWGAKYCRASKEYSYGFKRVGYCSSLRGALSTILKDCSKNTLSLANHQTLMDAMTIIKQIYASIDRRCADLKPQDFREGKVIDSAMLWKTIVEDAQ